MARIEAFKPTEYDTTQRDFTNLPDGDYALEIEKSEVVATKSGTGTMIKWTYNVLDPENFRGRKLFGQMNIANDNAIAQEIGQREFASLCRAIGESNDVEDTEELHFRSFTAKIGLGKPSKDGQYPARNEIKKYYFPDEGVPEPKAAPTAANDNRLAARPAAAANDNRPPAKAAGSRPWDKKAA